MTLMYMFGLAAGSLVAYSIENSLGPIEDHPCGPMRFMVSTTMSLKHLIYSEQFRRWYQVLQ